MRPASEWREAPYPGERPDTSFIQVDDVVLMLQEDRSGATVDGTDLDAWLLGRGEKPMAARTPVLSYGSNACPSKLLRMRGDYRLTGAVVMTSCTVEGWAGAWCDGYRRDGVVPATLVEAPGIEEHFLWWVDGAQWSALDACEGAPFCVRVATGPGHRAGHGRNGCHWCPRLCGGGAESTPPPRRVRRPDPGPRARTREGAGAAVTAQVFVYGTLMPGQPRWRQLEPYTAGEPVRDQVAGRLLDTGCGYPGLVALGGAALVQGWVVTLAEDRLMEALGRLDEIEGTEVGLYKRERVITTGGRTCWTYRYLHADDAMTDLGGVWSWV